jgi:hypothetical protein
MAGRRALIGKDDLDRMASVCAAHGVVIKGRVDPLGGFTFTMSPQADATAPGNDDLDDRLDDFAAL